MSATLLNPGLLFNLLTRRLRRIVTIAVLVFVVLVAGIVLMAPLYSGTAIVLIDPRQQRVLQSDAVLTGIGNDMAAVDSQVEVIQSATIATKVIDDLKLDQDPEFVPSTNPIVELVRSLVGGQPESKMRYALQRFATNLKVRRRGATYILEIEFRSRSAERSAQIANAVANAYVAQQLTLRSSATSEASSFLADRLTDLRKQSTDADAAVARYREQNGLVNSGEKRSVVEQQLADINQQLVVASIRTEEVRSRLKQIDKASSDPAARQSLVETLASPVIVALRAQYAQAFKSGAELAQSLGPLHPALKTSQAEQAALSRQIDAEVSRILLGVKNEYEAAQAREKALDTNLVKLKASMASNDRSMVRLHELEREAEAAQAILQRSLARYKETKEQEGTQAAEARILSPATIPVSANGPNRKLLLAVALIASIVIAILLAVVTDQAVATPIIPVTPSPPVPPTPAPTPPAPMAPAPTPTPTAPPPSPALHRNPKPRPETVAELPPQLPVLGYLPEVGVSRGGNAPSWRSRGGDSDRVMGRSNGFVPTSPFSPFDDAIRQLAGDFAAVIAKRPYIIAITGGAAGVGTSTVAATFADAIARGVGQRVLRIDAGHVAQGERRVGLAQTIRGKLPAEFAIDKTSEGAADVLHFGVANEAQFLGIADSLAVHDSLIYLSVKYDVIVIDTGLPITTPQSQRLIALSDSALLVASDARTLHEPAVVTAVKARYNHLDGLVMNRVSGELDREARPRAADVAPERRVPVTSLRMTG